MPSGFQTRRLSRLCLSPSSNSCAKGLRPCWLASVRLRCVIAINLPNGCGTYETAAVLNVHNTRVYRVGRRFREHSEWSLWDGRQNDGETKWALACVALVARLATNDVDT